MTTPDEERKEYIKEWLRQHPEARIKIQYKSKAKNFITKRANLDDLEEVEGWIKQRRELLKNKK